MPDKPNTQKNSQNTALKDDAQSRIVYLEPNDINGQVDGVPVTPDYTDFCISFDLIVDTVSRMRANQSTINREVKVYDENDENEAKMQMKTFVFSWTSRKALNEKEKNELPNRVSFMTGQRYGTRNYLTTFYTDTHFNDFKNKTIVEGLGVESVNISFESYYTPTIKIRFIDVRGASIFGREEHLHTDEVLAEDNIWGCFFTFPYPKYRLQVKGFYGQAVTYQLCCTDFRAHINSQTGNYEIDMTFLGYDFGLLADIPMQYLIAAPYCRYADTNGYWLKNKTSNEDWKMDNGDEVETFFKMRQRIEETIAEIENGNKQSDVTVEEMEMEIVDGERQAMLDQMKPYIENIQKFAKSVQDDNDKITGHSSEESKRTPVLLQDGSNQFQNGVINVQEKWLGDEIHYRIIKWFFSSPSGTDSFKLTQEQQELLLQARNSGYSLLPLLNDFNKKYPKWYLSVFNEEYLKSLIQTEIDTIILPQDVWKKFDRLFNTFKEANENNYNIETVSAPTYGTTGTATIDPINGRKIQELVGIIPNIGNVFRTLFCHLETFTHMVYTCAGNIMSQMNQGDRSLKKLGLDSIDTTDIVLDTPTSKETNPQIPPFPGVYTYQKSKSNEDNTTEDENEDSDIMVDAWPGETRGKAKVGPWEEEILINELFKAVLSVSEEGDKSNSAPLFTSTSFPVLPSDLNHSNIAGVGFSSSKTKQYSESFAGYLALRASALFGVANFISDEAKDVGMADAIQFFESIISKDEIENILKGFGGGDKTNTIIDTVQCKGNLANNQLPFEKAKNVLGKKNDRHPMLIQQQGSAFMYCHTWTKDKQGLLPSRLSSWEATQGDALEFEGNGTQSYYSLKSSSDISNILYTAKSENLFPTEIDTDKFLNNEMCMIYYGGEYGDGEAASQKVTEKYEALKSGIIDLNGYKVTEEEAKKRNPFTKILKNHWKNISDNEYKDKYYTKFDQLYPPLNIMTIEGQQKKTEEVLFTKDTATRDIDKMMEENVVHYSNGTFKVKDKEMSIDDCQVFYPRINICGRDNPDDFKVNVFTSSIYVYQNEASGMKNGTINWSTRGEAKDCMKALIFLLAMNVVKNTNTKPSFINKKLSVIEGVPLSYILLIGGLLWRKKFMKENEGLDPMQYSDGENTNFNFRQLKADEIPFVIDNYGNIIASFIPEPNIKLNFNYAKLSEIFNTSTDIAIQNQLIDKFRKFVDGDWQTIEQNCDVYKESASDYIKLITSISDENKSINQSGYIILRRYYYKDEAYKIGNISIPQYLGLFGILSENNPALPLIKKIYLSKVVVQRTICTFDDKGSISFPQQSFRSYVEGFIEQLNLIMEQKSSSPTAVIEDTADDTKLNVDIKRLMYMFIKSLWDKWFSANDEQTFSVKNYMANTVFIDSMYRNVYSRIHINCEILADLLSEQNGESMVFKFMSDLTTKHHCMFFALPDYLDIGSTDGKKSRDAMNTLFTPCPYSKIAEMTTFNRYIVMFTHKPSEISSSTNDYQYDSFDIYSHSDDKDSIKPLPTFDKPVVSESLKKENNEHDIQCSRYGYYIPAFGVEYGRQNNAIFKKIDVGMQNPVQTEQSINALSLIASRGRGAGYRTVFYGQDLYPVYSGYSYTATIEMMGNAQIMPLMYFQLFNVPMFRGAYMIYSVTHTMRPGDMTTTVKAMKMSKRTLPWCKDWYAHYYFDEQGNILSDTDDECGVISGDYPWMTVAQRELKKGVQEVPRGSNKGPEVDKYLKSVGLSGGYMWCGAFVAWCLQQVNIEIPKGASVASSWKGWGQSLDKPAFGAIALCSPDKNGKIGHVGFVNGVDSKGNVYVLGGNQSDTITSNTWWYSTGRIVGYVFPKGYKPTYVLQTAEEGVHTETTWS